VEKNHLKNKELLSAVTHEIKNSLNPVINLSSILLRNNAGRLTPEENSYLEVIERNGKKILNLVEEFSFLNKLSGREKKHSVSSVPVREMIDNAVMNMMALSSDSDCKIICDVEDSTSLLVTEKDVFRKILESICLFFLSTCGDTAYIYFKTSFSDSKFNLVSSHKKTSAEMNDQDLFDKEKIVDKGFSRSSVMWLIFAVLYIYHLKGEAWFSCDEEGSPVFSFSIPAAAGESKKPGHAVSTNKDIIHHAGREFIMLVIDDDIDNIIPVNAIIENEFKGMGKVYHAESGGKGLDMLGTMNPDIILLDLTLPDISGLSLVRNIKHLFVKKNIPVIAFTGLDIAADKEKMIKSGFDDVIRKPFNIDAFIQKIREWID
jgi:CheY-like chemotaxis protein